MGFWDSLGSSIIQSIAWVINLLPDSPFQAVSNTDVDSFLGSLNWMFGLDAIVSTLQAWLVAIAVFYLIQVILRWVKVIQ